MGPCWGLVRETQGDNSEPGIVHELLRPSDSGQASGPQHSSGPQFDAG